MKMKSLIFTILVSPTIIFSSTTLAQNLTGPGSTIQDTLVMTTSNDSQSNSFSVKDSLGAVYNAIENQSWVELEKTIVDVMLVAVQKSGVSIDVNDTSVRNAFRRRLSGYLKGTAIGQQNIKASVGKVGVGVVKGLIVSSLIKVSTDLIYEQTGSLAAKEGVWLALKMADSAISSNGNPLAAAVGQGLILKEVIEKDMAAADEALKSGYSLKRVKVTSQLMSLISEGAQNYSRGAGNIVSTRLAIEELINSSDLPDITKQEFKNSYLVDSSEGSVFNLFKRVLENRDIRRQELLLENNGPEYEAFISAYYPADKQEQFRNEFDNHNTSTPESPVYKEEIAAKNEERQEKLKAINEQDANLNWLKENQEKETAKNDEISTEISRLNNQKNAYQAELDSLLANDGSQTNTDLSELKNIRFAILQAGKRLHSGRWENTGDIDENLVEHLEKAAAMFGVSYKKFVILLKSNYEVRAAELTRQIDSFNSSNGSTNNEARIAYLRDAISMLDLEIAEKDAAIQTSRELLNQQSNLIRSTQNNLDTLVKEHALILSDMNDLTNDFNDELKEVTAAQAPSFVADEWFGSHSFSNASTGIALQEAAQTTNNGQTAITSGSNVALNLSTLANSVNTGTNDHFGNYSYTAWGQWSGSNSYTGSEMPGASDLSVTHGHWVIGAGNKNEIPQQGSATYNGELRGDWAIGANNIQNNAIGGNITVNADFASQKVFGSMAVTCGGNSCATASFNDLSMQSGTGDWGGAMTVVGGGQGAINGAFYGPQAAETGGGFEINKPDNTNISGVFRAKQ